MFSGRAGQSHLIIGHGVNVSIYLSGQQLPKGATHVRLDLGAFLHHSGFPRRAGHATFPGGYHGDCHLRRGLRSEHSTHIEEFGKSNEDWFRTFPDLSHGIPRHETFGRLFAAMDPDAVEQAFQAWVHALAGSCVGRHPALDGKTLRRRFDRADESGLHWTLDVSFGEDDHRVRVDNASENLSRVRRIDLMLLKQEKPSRSASRGSA